LSASETDVLLPWSSHQCSIGTNFEAMWILIAIAVVKHLGWISGAYDLLRRRRTSRAMRP
jgi:hypothetical protein